MFHACHSSGRAVEVLEAVFWAKGVVGWAGAAADVDVVAVAQAESGVGGMGGVDCGGGVHEVGAGG